MRISDWSSDVCSSDLVGLQAVCEHFIGKLLCLLASPSEHRFENRRGRQEDLSTPEFVDNNPCHLARADAGLRDRDRKGHDFTKRLAIESPEPVRSSGIDEMLAAGLVPMGIGGKSFRSEEHTSELQSLMRISYAVFCLKKKTKKQ